MSGGGALASHVSSSSSGPPSGEALLLELVDALRMAGLAEGGPFPMPLHPGGRSQPSHLPAGAARAHSEPPRPLEEEGGVAQPAGGSCGMAFPGASLSMAGLALRPLHHAASGPEAAAAAPASPQPQQSSSGSFAFGGWLGSMGRLGLPITPYEHRRSLDLFPPGARYRGGLVGWWE